MVRVLVVGAVTLAVGLTILVASDLGIPTEVSGPIMVLAALSAKHTHRHEIERAF